MKENPEFLKNKYDLNKSEEVESAAKRTEKRLGEKLPQKPEVRIQNYLDRFKEIVERKDPEERHRGMEAIKKVLHEKFVIKPEEIPDSYLENQRRIAREQGRGNIEITPEIRKQAAEIIIADQRSSLDNWINYLTSEDAKFYPDWLKYWATRSVLGIGEYDKDKQQFTKRSKGTVKPFPGLNREALAYVLDTLEKKYEGKEIDLDRLDEKDQRAIQSLLQGENFAKLYAFALEKVVSAGEKSLENTSGRWVKYEQDSDPLPLVQSLQGHNTGWCTATSDSIARGQLQGGDFYVYYSLDKYGQPSVPRAAIRTQEGQIAEVRGIAAEQNLDPYIGTVVQKKLKEFPDGPKYEKKVGDMKFLTQIENKTNEGEKLNSQELRFLYELEAPIEGFGYDRDPRIKELRSRRNPEEDMPIVFECKEDQIAHNIKEIQPSTKVYVGKLEPGLFEVLPASVENIYTKFPEGKIRREAITIGGRTTKQLEKELAQKNIALGSYAKDMMESKDFTTLKTPEKIELVRLKVGDLGFSDYVTTEKLYARAKELGLELCPAEVGPDLRLKYSDSSSNEYFFIGMKPITGRGGYPFVFGLARGGGRLWLGSDWAGPGSVWGPGCGFVFRLRPPQAGKQV